MKKHIPNTITCLNLFSGCIACVMALEENFMWAFGWIAIAAVFDFFDGFAARLLNAYSNIGKELDSLADVISFGLAPGLMIFSLLQGMSRYIPLGEYLCYLAFLIPVFSALRLAKFNIDDRQTSSFIGLPTPANGLFWAAAVPSILGGSIPIPKLLGDFTAILILIILILIIVSCLLMVSEIQMFSLKFKNYGWKGNESRYILIASTIASVCLLGYSGISISILIYIFLSVITRKCARS